MSLKHALLAALSENPQTGYDLSRAIDGSIGYFWNATHQQIYKELNALEQIGWIEFKAVKQNEKPDKKIYRLTRSGLKELKAWIAEEAELPTAKDQLLIKLFAGHLVDPKIILNTFEKQYEMRKQRLQKFLDIEAKYFKDKELPLKMKFQYMTIRRGIISERAWIEWAKEVLVFLRNI